MGSLRAYGGTFMTGFAARPHPRVAFTWESIWLSLGRPAGFGPWLPA